MFSEVQYLFKKTLSTEGHGRKLSDCSFKGNSSVLQFFDSPVAENEATYELMKTQILNVNEKSYITV